MPVQQLVDRIVEHLETLEESDKETLAVQLSSEVTSPQFGLEASDYPDLLFDSLEALRAAVDRGLLVTLAPQMLENIRTHIEKVATQQGQPAQNWAGNIVALNIMLWHGRIIGEASEATKLRADVQELRKWVQGLKRRRKELDEAQVAAQSVEEFRSESEQQLDEIKEQVKESEKLVKRLKELESQAISSDTQAQASRENVAAHEKETETRRARIQEFFERVEEHTTKMATAEQTAVTIRKQFEETAATTEQEFQEFFEEATNRREAYEKEIRALTDLAVGTSLFRAFDVEKQRLAGQTKVWGIATLLSVAASIAFAFWLAWSVRDFSPSAKGAAESTQREVATEGAAAVTRPTYPPGFWIKLSTTPLFLFAIGFCARQYSAHRRLQHAYAFKATLSLSLEAYRKLVMGMLETAEDKSIKEHLEFVVDTIRQIFTSPEHRLSKEDPVLKDLLKTMKKQG